MDLIGEPKAPSNKRKFEKIIKKTKRRIANNLNLQCVGVGAGGDYERLGLDFDCYSSLGRDEARFLALSCFEIFENSIQEENALNAKKGIAEYNLSIGLTVYSIDKDYKHYPDPYICFVSINSDELFYRTDDPEERFKYKNAFTETLEEARAKNSEYLKSLADGSASKPTPSK